MARRATAALCLLCLLAAPALARASVGVAREAPEAVDVIDVSPEDEGVADDEPAAAAEPAPAPAADVLVSLNAPGGGQRRCWLQSCCSACSREGHLALPAA